MIFGGTEEGRRLAEILRDTGWELHVCVATSYGASLLALGEKIHIHTGRMDQEAMEELFQEVLPFHCVDATHPYAKEVSETVQGACQAQKVPYLRILRGRGDGREWEEAEALWFSDVQEIVSYLSKTRGRILITTGSKELEPFTCLERYQERCYIRVLPSVFALEECARLGFLGSHLLAMQGPFDVEFNLAMLKQTGAAYLVTKDSGKAGGFMEKCRAAALAGAKLLILERPEENTGETPGMQLWEAAAWLRASYAADPKPKRRLALIGIGPGRPEDMTVEAAKRLSQCDVILGSPRALEACSPFQKPDTKVAAYVKGEEMAVFLEEHPGYQNAAAVFSGDVGFYSGAKGLREHLKHPEDWEVCSVSGIASPIYFLNRLGIPWQEVYLASGHGREISSLLPAIRDHQRVCVLLGGPEDAARLCRGLLEFGRNDLNIAVGERLSYPQESIERGRPKDFCNRRTDPLSVAYFEHSSKLPPTPLGIPNEEWVRGKVPMTKEEIRVLCLAKLRLGTDSVLYDVGAGTGSVAAEAALWCKRGRVYAVERRWEAVELLKENKRKFFACNMEIVPGEAPEALEDLEAPTHLFLGGTGGRFMDILAAVRRKSGSVRVVMTAVTLETIAQAMELPCGEMEILQLQVSRAKERSGYHLMSSENPVYILAFEWKRPL